MYLHQSTGESWIVVVNHEEQYSILRAGTLVPPGWSSVGVSGDEAACLDHIEAVWTDQRPRSVRDALANHQASR